MVKMKRSKELKAIGKAIENWVNKHKGNVCFFGEFVAFKGKEFEVFDDKIMAYGSEDVIKIGINELKKEIKKDKDKDDFVNF